MQARAPLVKAWHEPSGRPEIVRLLPAAPQQPHRASARLRMGCNRSRQSAAKGSEPMFHVKRPTPHQRAPSAILLTSAKPSGCRSLVRTDSVTARHPTERCGNRGGSGRWSAPIQHLRSRVLRAGQRPGFIAGERHAAFGWGRGTPLGREPELALPMRRVPLKYSRCAATPRRAEHASRWAPSSIRGEARLKERTQFKRW